MSLTKIDNLTLVVAARVAAEPSGDATFVLKDGPILGIGERVEFTDVVIDHDHRLG